MTNRVGKNQTQDLTRQFTESLEAGYLRTPGEIDEAQKLRYRVYCLARGFDDPKQVRIRISQPPSSENPTVIPFEQRTEIIDTKDFTSIALGLLGMALKTSLDAGITHWLVIMEPALARLLSRQGMKFEPAGPITNFHGKRQPMLARVDDLLSGIHATKKDFFYLIRHFQETVEDLHQPQIAAHEIPSQEYQDVCLPNPRAQHRVRNSGESGTPAVRS